MMGIYKYTNQIKKASNSMQKYHRYLNTNIYYYI